ncbi:MAG TPA: hypothetical protein VMX79_10850 [bacterium]|nr:hypothetical protein [bacterium]
MRPGPDADVSASRLFNRSRRSAPKSAIDTPVYKTYDDQFVAISLGLTYGIY